ncbi:CoA-binding protein [Escherichia coli]|nr:CoA-binding protein [Escherichia coli]
MKETDIAGIITSTQTNALGGASDKSERPTYHGMKCPIDQVHAAHQVHLKTARKTLRVLRE